MFSQSFYPSTPTHSPQFFHQQQSQPAQSSHQPSHHPFLPQHLPSSSPLPLSQPPQSVAHPPQDLSSPNPVASSAAPKPYLPGFLTSPDFGQDVSYSSANPAGVSSSSRRSSYPNATDPNTSASSPDHYHHHSSPRSAYPRDPYIYAKEQPASRYVYKHYANKQSSTPSSSSVARGHTSDDTMDTPPVVSLDDEMLSHSPPHDYPSSSSTAAATTTTATAATSDTLPSSLPPGTTTAPPIIVFGFQPAHISAILEYFAQHGEIVSHKYDADNQSNFVTIVYKDPPAALRAVRRNGEVVGGATMIGVKWADSNFTLDDYPSNSVTNPSASSNNIIHNHHNNTTASSQERKILHRHSLAFPPPNPSSSSPSPSPSAPQSRIAATPINLVTTSSDALFKRPETSVRKAAHRASSYFSLSSKAAPNTPHPSSSSSSSSPSSSSHASLFANRDNALKDAQPPANPPQGFLGRFGEIVFGS